jgi:predicted transcriptional regulator
METQNKNLGLFLNGILNLQGATPSEKILMMQIAVSESLGHPRINVTKSADQIGYTRNGWQKIAKRLIAKGFIQNPKRGYYELANTNIF